LRNCRRSKGAKKQRNSKGAASMAEVAHIKSSTGKKKCEAVSPKISRGEESPILFEKKSVKKNGDAEGTRKAASDFQRVMKERNTPVTTGTQ